MKRDLPIGAEYDCGYWGLPNCFGRVVVRRVPDGYDVVVVSYDRATLRKTECVQQLVHNFDAAKAFAWAVAHDIQRSGVC